MFSNELWQKSGVSTYSIDQSIRFNQSDNAYLTKTFGGSASNRRTHTYSFWLKLGANAAGANSSGGCFFLSTNDSGASAGDYLHLNGDLKLRYWSNESSASTFETNQLFRDFSAWYHIVLVNDRDNSTASDSVRLYVNGQRVTSFAVNNITGRQNQDTMVNASSFLWMIQRFTSSTVHGDAYMAEIVFIDGQALDPSSFGEYNDSNIWIPKDVSGLTFGTNGFYIKGQLAGKTNAITALGNIQHSTAQSKIGSSSILFDGTGDLLEVGGSSNWYDFGADGNPWTMEAYIRFDTVSITQKIFWQDNTFIGISYVTGSGIKVQLNNGGINFTASWSPSINTWYHFAVVRETNNTTTVYIDGTSIGSGTISGGSGASYKVEIGAQSPSTDEFDGYMDEIRISSVARFTSSFTPTTTEYTADEDTLALIHSNTTNGSTVFKNDVGFGNDSSGNQNNFVTSGLASHDQVADSPTNSFAVLNPLDERGSGTLSDGNLQMAFGATNDNVTATQGLNTGKWYWEVYIVDKDDPYVGVQDSGVASTGYTEDAVALWVDGGYIYEDGSDTGDRSTTYANGDIVGVAFDVDNKKIWWSKNGQWYSADDSSTATINISEVEAGNQAQVITRSPDFFMPFVGNFNTGTVIMNFGQEGTFAGNVTAGGNSDGNGVGNFKYSVPSGYLALCTKNLGS